MERTAKELNESLDEIIKLRHSVRVFKEDEPPKEFIEDIIKAGMLAPYAKAAVGGKKDFRRFFIFKKDGSSTRIAAQLMKKKAREGIEHFGKIVAGRPNLKPKFQPFTQRLQMVVDKGVPGLETAPYFIVAAELRGVPPVEQESLAHVLENMWLKATALGLGFQLVSLTSQMADNEEFMDLLGLPNNKFALNGCAVGYPAVEVEITARPDIGDTTRWMD
jgi:nitroreductase